MPTCESPQVIFQQQQKKTLALRTNKTTSDKEKYNKSGDGKRYNCKKSGDGERYKKSEW